MSQLLMRTIRQLTAKKKERSEGSLSDRGGKKVTTIDREREREKERDTHTHTQREIER
jgi:hypothetical protein